MNAITTRNASTLAPSNIGEAMKFAELLASSDMVPRDFKGKPANCLVAIQWGYEVGLGPLQALQNIAVINNRPSIWGDAALALVRAHPACAGVREWIDGDGDAMTAFCEVSRRGEQPQVRTFTVADAKKAGLWGKQGPWQQYPARMLQMRARGFAIRDVFPDALRGVITTEEAQDLPSEPREVPNLAAQPAPRPGLPPVEDEPEFDWLTMQGKRITLARAQWVKALGKALAALEDATAVRAWADERNEIFASLYDVDAELATNADEAIQARIAFLAGEIVEGGK
jgi:hypothetical protein